MKHTYDIEIITGTCQSEFEKRLKKVVYQYEERNYEVEIQYSISKDENLGMIYSALVRVYANFNRNGYRID